MMQIEYINISRSFTLKFHLISFDNNNRKYILITYVHNQIAQKHET